MNLCLIITIGALVTVEWHSYAAACDAIEAASETMAPGDCAELYFDGDTEPFFEVRA